MYFKHFFEKIKKHIEQFPENRDVFYYITYNAIGWRCQLWFKLTLTISINSRFNFRFLNHKSLIY